MTTHQQFASGLRIEARDAEWRIKQRVDHSSDGGYLLTCEGLSEIVRGKESLFLTKQETQGAGIRILDPETNQLVDDLTPNFRASLLYLDTLLRSFVIPRPGAEGNLHSYRDRITGSLGNFLKTR